MIPPASHLATHEVANQPGARPPSDPWAEDAALRGWVARLGADARAPEALGAAILATDAWEAGRLAGAHPPEARPFDAAGRRLDEVRFHPAYHELMALGLGAGYASVAWDGTRGGHVAHAALVYLMTQVEPGLCCPMTMTHAAVPALDGAQAALWRPRLAAAAYDPAVAPVGEKAAATLGMAMTEKQGGSDLRATATRAEPDGDAHRLTGHKWFCSAPMCDGFLTLAQAPGGLTCFLVPRWLSGGRNAIRLLRLKDKLGNRANASAEIEYEGALAHRIGEEGRGIPAILRMVHETRLDTAMAPAGLMRAALAEAIHWTGRRTAFGRRLADQPLMRRVLADLALDWEGALGLGLWVASAMGDPGRRPLARLAVALAKFLANKRCVAVVAEAMEARGGMGYVEETPMPALYREAPLNGIWEGSGNVMCLDVLRTLAREPEAAEALAAELDAARGADRAYDAAVAAFRSRWRAGPEEAEARLFVERAAILLTASILLRHAPDAVGQGYVRARLDPGRGSVPGAVAGLDEDALLGRLAPADARP